MSLSEAQLETWSGQGKTGQFMDTYNSIRDNLLDKNAAYPIKDCEVFLQGSYGNDTNIYGDSDVDIVLKHNGAFYYDLTNLSEADKVNFNTKFSNNASYGYTQFKADATQWIERLYKGVVAGKKAVKIPANGNRRKADILIAAQFRRYYEFNQNGTTRYEEGVSFYSESVLIKNFPRQHSVNCTAKHQATSSNYKRMVRVFKNMRNSMIQDGFLKEGVAPSYFIEGMLYNVPNGLFSGNYVNMWIECFNWLVKADRDKLVCANQLHWLVRDDSPTSWPTANFLDFTRSAKKYWER